MPDLPPRPDLERLRDQAEDLEAVAFAPEGNRFATVGKGRLALRDVATGEVRRDNFGRYDGVRTLALSPDGRSLAAAVPGRGIVVWEASTGVVRARYSSDRRATCASSCCAAAASTSVPAPISPSST